MDEIIFTVLNRLNKNPNFSWKDIGLSKEDFCKALMIIRDEVFYTNIGFSGENLGYDKMIPFYNNGHITLKGSEFLKRKEKQQDNATAKPTDETTVFISYSWNDSDIVDEIDKELEKRKVSIKRDKKCIKDWDSITDFMKTIRVQDYVVVIISDNYLKSNNCMYEVLELMKDDNYKYRVLPVVVGDDVYNPESRLGYVKYWQDKAESYKNRLKDIEDENKEYVISTLNHYNSVAKSIGEFISFICDTNNPNEKDVVEKIMKFIEINKH